MGGGVQQTPLDNQTEIALKILVFCAEALCLFLKFIQKYFSNKYFFLYDPRFTKLWALKVTKVSFFEIYDQLPFWEKINCFDSTCRSKSMNISFLTKIIDIMTSFSKNPDLIVKLILQKKFWYGTLH